MKKRIVSLMLAVFSTLALCVSAFAAEAKTFAHWNVYLENGGIFGRCTTAAAADTTAPTCRPAWLPEGWTLDSAAVMGKAYPVTDWAYSKGEESLYFQCCAPCEFFFSNHMGEGFAAAAAKKTVKIQGYPAIFWQLKQDSALAWEDSQGKLFLLLHTGSLTQAELEKIANNITDLTEPMPEYHLGWVPEGSEMYPSEAMPGYMRDAGNGPDYIRFFYATQPLTAPKGTPEAVTVQGVPAQLWLGDPNATGVIVTSSITGKTAEIPTEDTWSTLIWTDPETGICFCIQGHKLTKETMLHIAESVILDKTAPKAEQSASAAKPAANTASAANSTVDPNTSRKSWVADGWKATLTRADGTVEELPNFSELFPGQKLPTG